MRRPRPALPCRNCLAGRAMTGAHPLRGLTCAVIGGGGFLGANLCPKLLALGAIVRVYGRTRYYDAQFRSEEHTSELQSLMRNSYAVFCLKTTKKTNDKHRFKTTTK